VFRRGPYWRGTKSPLGISPPGPSRLFANSRPVPAWVRLVCMRRISCDCRPRCLDELRSLCRCGLRRTPAMSDSLRPARSARANAGLTPVEVALLEVLGSWERSVELAPADAWARLRVLLTSGQARPERLAHAAKTEPGRVRARLRELLRAAGRGGLAGMVPAPDERTATSATRMLRDDAHAA